MNLINIKPDFTLEINMLEAVANDKFARVMQRKRIDKNNDPTGEDKWMNVKEMVFVVLYANKSLEDSSFAALDREQKISNIRTEIGLPHDWYPDTVVKEAIKEYGRIQKERNPTLNVLNSLERGLMVQGEAIESFNRTTRLALKRMKNIENTMQERDLTPEEANLLEIYSSTTVSNLQEILKIGEKLPKVLDSIGTLLVQVKKERGEAKRKKGGKRVRNREIPR